jgi:Ca-activated chloride channel family protein
MKTKVFLLIVIGLITMNLTTVKAQLIKGQVFDATDKTPLLGVCVVVKGTTVGTVTDAQGDYQVQMDSLHTTLVFSFIGYETKEFLVKGRTVVNVGLNLSAMSLDECVVVGYGEQKQMDAVQAISSVFSGRVAGVKVRGNAKRACMAPSEMYVHENFNTEGYSTIHENGFTEVNLNPLSTFSIDVDAASYSNIRRYINSGSLPPVDAVRIEEMINYFTYDYPQPEGNVPFSIHTELAKCPWNNDNYLLHVGLQGKKIDSRELPASNLVFLIDVSGSMQDANKLPLLKSSFILLTEQLRPQDRIAIVVYAGNSGMVLPSTPGSNKQKIKEALENLQAGGSTAGGEGIKLAYKIAEENFMDQGNNRIILATDGDFNVGASSNAEMERLIEKEREKGIFISVLGFGMGNYKDDKMEIIADKGNGNYSYIDNLQEAKKVLVSEFGGTLFTIAKDVKFQLEFNPAQVAKYRLIGYENRLLNEEDFEDDKKDAGEMGAGHSVTALYEIVPVKDLKTDRKLKYQNQNLTEAATQSNDLVTLKLRYKEPDGFQSKLIDKVVLNQPIALNELSGDFRFSASVAEFGMLLRDSEFKGTATFESAIELAKRAKGSDDEGYRCEMIRLIQTAAMMKNGSAFNE